MNHIILASVPLVLLCALILGLGLLCHRRMIHGRSKSEARIRAEHLERGDIRQEQLDLPWIEDRIDSPLGYGISLRYLAPPRPRGLALFHHGLGGAWCSMLPQMEIFLDQGWAVAALESRRGLCPSYGVLEKIDLRVFADWALGRFPDTRRLVLLGVSLGAATVLQYAPLDPRLEAAIADCPFSSAAAELDYMLSLRHIPRWMRGPVIRVVDLLCRAFDGFSLLQADAQKAALKADIPLLFIHGLEDDFVPTSMSSSMVQARRLLKPEAVTELFLVPGARHADCVKVDPSGYARSVADFLESSARKGAGR